MFPHNNHGPSVLPQIRRSYVAIPQASAHRHSAPCSPLLHLVEQARHTSAQCPLAVLAYEEVLWRIFDDFLRHLSAFALPPSVADEFLVFGVMAAARVNPHRNRAHCVLTEFWVFTWYN